MQQKRRVRLTPPSCGAGFSGAGPFGGAALVVSDDHEGIKKAAVASELASGVEWQRGAQCTSNATYFGARGAGLLFDG